MKRYPGLAILISLIAIAFSQAIAAEKTAAEERIKEETMRLLEEKEEKKKLNFSSYYEYSWIKQASSHREWRYFTNRLAYSANKVATPYLEINSWDRFHDKDYAVDIGSYFKLREASYLRSEIGFGGDISYIYRFQTTLEYGQRLVNNYFGEFGYRYLNYTDNDVFIVYPGLVYYFGDHYLSAFYNASFTQGRGRAQWGTLRGSAGVNERLNLWLGTAIGQRLYDIDNLNAQDQYGYIVFGGIDFKLYKELSVRLGYSYSKERPAFIKRSLDYGVSMKF